MTWQGINGENLHFFFKMVKKGRPTNLSGLNIQNVYFALSGNFFENKVQIALGSHQCGFMYHPNVYTYTCTNVVVIHSSRKRKRACKPTI